MHLGVDNIHKVGAIGILGYGWEAKIIDSEGNEVPQGEVGELAVKGLGVTKCYYNDEEATKEVLHGDCLHTGDVAVIGLKDEWLDEIAAAIIELVSGAVCTEEEIDEFCKGMPRYKRPRKVFFSDVPRNPTGKIEKPKLRKMYQSENLVDAQNRE